MIDKKTPSNKVAPCNQIDVIQQRKKTAKKERESSITDNSQTVDPINHSRWPKKHKDKATNTTTGDNFVHVIQSGVGSLGWGCEMKVINRLHPRLLPSTSGAPTGLFLSLNCQYRSRSGVDARDRRRKRRVRWYRRGDHHRLSLEGERRRRTDSKYGSAVVGCLLEPTVRSGSGAGFCTVSASIITCSNDGIHHGLCLFQR